MRRALQEPDCPPRISRTRLWRILWSPGLRAPAKRLPSRAAQAPEVLNAFSLSVSLVCSGFAGLDLAGLPGGDQIKRHIHDHVFLAAHHLAAAEFDEDVARIDAMILRSLLGMPEEGGVDAGIAERQGFPVDLNRTVLQRADKVFGGVHHAENIASVLPAFPVRRCNEHLERRIARARAHTGQ